LDNLFDKLDLDGNNSLDFQEFRWRENSLIIKERRKILAYPEIQERRELLISNEFRGVGNFLIIKVSVSGKSGEKGVAQWSRQSSDESTAWESGNSVKEGTSWYSRIFGLVSQTSWISRNSGEEWIAGLSRISSEEGTAFLSKTSGWKDPS
jgi:hypothetical protein